MFADSANKFDVKNAGLFIYVDDSNEIFKKAIIACATIVTGMTYQSF